VEIGGGWGSGEYRRIALYDGTGESGRSREAWQRYCQATHAFNSVSMTAISTAVSGATVAGAFGGASCPAAVFVADRRPDFVARRMVDLTACCAAVR